MAVHLDWNIIDAFMNLLGLFTVNKDGRHFCTSSYKDEANSSWIRVPQSRRYLGPAHKPERDSAVNQLMLIINIKHDESVKLQTSITLLVLITKCIFSLNIRSQRT